MTRRRSVIALIALAIGVVGVVIAALTTALPRAPDDATLLTLRTYPTRLELPWAPRSCALGGSRLVKVVQDDGALVFDYVDSGVRAPVVFPSNFQAWSIGGSAVLVSPEGYVLAREGEVLDGLGGSYRQNGDFYVCFTSPTEYDQVVRGR